MTGLTVKRIFRQVGEPYFPNEKHRQHLGGEQYVELPPGNVAPMPPGINGWFLEPGTYIIEWSNRIVLFGDTVASVFPQPALVRLGSTISGAVLEKGFRGTYRSLLTVGSHLLLDQGAEIGRILVYDQSGVHS